MRQREIGQLPLDPGTAAAYSSPVSNASLVILDLCGGTGAWSLPYREAGYDVRLIDPVADSGDVRLYRPPKLVHGVLCAPPCTVFSYARNRYKPTDEEFLEALSVVDACLRIAWVTRPKWWALENPRNKLRRWLGEPDFLWHQWEYGGEGHKPTGLWGKFTAPGKMLGQRTKPSTFGTKQENASPHDAVTPAGFARAFFEANR